MEAWEALLPSPIFFRYCSRMPQKNYYLKKKKVCLLRAQFSQEEILHFLGISPSINSSSFKFKLKNLLAGYFLNFKLLVVLQGKEFLSSFVLKKVVDTSLDTSEVWHPSRNFTGKCGNSTVQDSRYYCCIVVCCILINIYTYLV